MRQLIEAYLASGGAITLCKPGVAHSRIRWFMTSHPTRQIPLALGIVGRW